MLNFFRLLFFILIIIIHAGRPGYGQESRLLVSHEKINLSYGAQNDPAFRHDRMVIREVAKDVLKEPWRVSIRIDIRLVIRLSEQAGGGWILQVTRQMADASGDVVYRRFPIRKFLIPSAISFTLKNASREDTSSFTAVKVAEKFPEVDDSEIYSVRLVAYDPESDTIMIRNLAVHFDSAGTDRFFQHLSLINDYYASCAVLDSLNPEAYQVDFSDPGKLPLAMLQVMEADRITELINTRDFPGKLLHGGVDPMDFSGKFMPVVRSAKSNHFNLKDEIRRQGRITWDGNIAPIADHLTSRMLSYVSRARLMNDIHGKIYQEYLDRWYSRESSGDDLSVALELLSRIYPDAQVDTLMMYVSKNIYASYQKKSLTLMEEGRYADAFSLMENAVLFRENNPFFRNGTGADNILSRAANGVYSSYATIASTCIDAGKMSMADEYLNKAGQYRAKHSGYITSDSLYQTVFTRLFFIRNASCHKLLDQSLYDEALACYRFIERSYDVHSLAGIRSELDRRIRQAQKGIFIQVLTRISKSLQQQESDSALAQYRDAVTLKSQFSPDPAEQRKFDSLSPLIAAIKYSRLYESGSEALGRRQFTLAISRFDEARVLSEKYGIAGDPELDSGYKRAMKQSILIKLSSNRKIIWSNMFDSAMAFVALTGQLASRNGLEQDPDVIMAIAKYNEKIEEQRCRNLGDSVDIRLIRADRWIATTNYLRAQELLREAISLSVSMNQCGYPIQPVLDTIAKYSQAAIYQQKISDANGHAATGEYNLVISDLENAACLYREQHLERFGLEYRSIDDFLEQRGNPLLTERAVSYYISRTEYLHALVFLKMMRYQNYPEQSATFLQQQLGSRLAAEDYLKNPRDQVASRLATYTDNQPWFSAFRSSYQGEWNRLAKLNSPK